MITFYILFKDDSLTHLRELRKLFADMKKSMEVCVEYKIARNQCEAPQPSAGLSKFTLSNAKEYVSDCWYE